MRRLRGELADLPRTMLAGLAVFTVGGSLDLIHHAAPLRWLPVLNTYLGRDAYLAHAMTLAGMVIILVGLLATGVQKRRVHGRGPPE